MSHYGRVSLVLGLTALLHSSLAVPGTFISNDKMDNQRLPTVLPGGMLNPIDSRTICEEHCSDHSTCDAYAYSAFHKICQIYKTEVGTAAVLQNMYKLYVREKSEDEGFSKYGTDYIILIHTLMTAVQAMDHCATMGGTLVAIKDQGLQDLLAGIVMTRVVFNAFIGITDKVEEGQWVYLKDNTPVKYTNWDWNGVWNRYDLSCAYMKVDGYWRHTNCGYKFKFFCQIPMF